MQGKRKDQQEASAKLFIVGIVALFIVALVILFSSNAKGQDKYAYLITIRTSNRTKVYRAYNIATADSIVKNSLKTMQETAGELSDKKPFKYLEVYVEKKEIVRKRKTKLKRIK